MSKNIMLFEKKIVNGSEVRKWSNHFISLRVKLFEFDVTILFLRVLNSEL